MTDTPFSTDKLNLYVGNYYSKTDREVTASFNVWRGRSSFVIRRKGSSGKPMFTASLSPVTLESYACLAESIVKGGPKSKIVSPLQVWDKEEGKFKTDGAIVIGVDEKLVPYIGVSSSIGNHAFPIRMPRPNPLSDDAVTTEMAAILTIKLVLNDTAKRLRYYEVLTNTKRDFSNNNNGGGNRQNNNSGGNNNGGNSGGSNKVLEDDEMPF